MYEIHLLTIPFKELLEEFKDCDYFSLERILDLGVDSKHPNGIYTIL
jgi:hypothetical protein